MSVKNILFFLFLSFISCDAQTQNKYTTRAFFNEGKDFAVNIKNWNSSDYIKLGFIAAGSFAVIQIDEHVRSFMMSDRGYYYSVPIEFGRYWGEPFPSIILASGLMMYGNASGNAETKKLGFEIGQAFFYSVAATTILKVATGRARPYNDIGNKNFYPFSSINNDFLSFPSGHTTIAFSLSTVLSHRAKNDFIKIIAFAPAFMTAFSRVYQDYHWTSDVFLGACVGYFTAKYFVNYHDKEANNNLVKPKFETINFRMSF